MAKLGADIEFEVLNREGRVVNAAQVLLHHQRPDSLSVPEEAMHPLRYTDDSKKEEKPFVRYYRGLFEASVGVDRCYNKLELRPAPSETVSGLLDNIRNLMKHFRNTYPGYTLSTKGSMMTLGGHIHFNVKPNPGLIWWLDATIGKYMIKLDSPLRRTSKYHQLGAWRRKAHGFEYRSLSSAIFACPRAAELFLTIAKKGMDEVDAREIHNLFNRFSEPINEVDLYRSYLESIIGPPMLRELYGFVQNYEADLSTTNVLTNWLGI